MMQCSNWLLLYVKCDDVLLYWLIFVIILKLILNTYLFLDNLHEESVLQFCQKKNFFHFLILISDFWCCVDISISKPLLLLQTLLLSLCHYSCVTIYSVLFFSESKGCNFVIFGNRGYSLWCDTFCGKAVNRLQQFWQALMTNAI